MSSINVEIKGIKEMKAHYTKISRQVPKATKKQMHKAALLVQGEAKKSIQRGGGGGTVTRYSPKRSQNKSAPKTPPATDRGNLVRSILTSLKQKNKEVVAIVYTRAKYATALEFGTRDMVERPFMKPALRKMKKKIMKLLKTGVNESL